MTVQAQTLIALMRNQGVTQRASFRTSYETRAILLEGREEPAAQRLLVGGKDGELVAFAHDAAGWREGGTLISGQGALRVLVRLAGRPGPESPSPAGGRDLILATWTRRVVAADAQTDSTRSEIALFAVTPGGLEAVPVGGRSEPTTEAPPERLVLPGRKIIAGAVYVATGDRVRWLSDRVIALRRPADLLRPDDVFLVLASEEGYVSVFHLRWDARRGRFDCVGVNEVAFDDRPIRVFTEPPTTEFGPELDTGRVTVRSLTSRPATDREFEEVTILCARGLIYRCDVIELLSWGQVDAIPRLGGLPGPVSGGRGSPRASLFLKSQHRARGALLLASAERLTSWTPERGCVEEARAGVGDGAFGAMCALRIPGEGPHLVVASEKDELLFFPMTEAPESNRQLLAGGATFRVPLEGGVLSLSAFDAPGQIASSGLPCAWLVATTTRHDVVVFEVTSRGEALKAFTASGVNDGPSTRELLLEELTRDRVEKFYWTVRAQPAPELSHWNERALAFLEAEALRVRGHERRGLDLDIDKEVQGVLEKIARFSNGEIRAALVRHLRSLVLLVSIPALTRILYRVVVLAAIADRQEAVALLRALTEEVSGLVDDTSQDVARIQGLHLPVIRNDSLGEFRLRRTLLPTPDAHGDDVMEASRSLARLVALLERMVLYGHSYAEKPRGLEHLAKVNMEAHRPIDELWYRSRLLCEAGEGLFMLRPHTDFVWQVTAQHIGPHRQLGVSTASDGTLAFFDASSQARLRLILAREGSDGTPVDLLHVAALREWTGLDEPGPRTHADRGTLQARDLVLVPVEGQSDTTVLMVPCSFGPGQPLREHAESSLFAVQLCAGPSSDTIRVCGQVKSVRFPDSWGIHSITRVRGPGAQSEQPVPRALLVVGFRCADPVEGQAGPPGLALLELVPDTESGGVKLLTLYDDSFRLKHDYNPVHVIQACFTDDSRQAIRVFAGTEDGRVEVWDADISGEKPVWTRRSPADQVFSAAVRGLVLVDAERHVIALHNGEVRGMTIPSPSLDFSDERRDADALTRWMHFDAGVVRDVIRVPARAFLGPEAKGWLILGASRSGHIVVIPESDAAPEAELTPVAGAVLDTVELRTGPVSLCSLGDDRVALGGADGHVEGRRLNVLEGSAARHSHTKRVITLLTQALKQHVETLTHPWELAPEEQADLVALLPWLLTPGLPVRKVALEHALGQKECRLDELLCHVASSGADRWPLTPIFVRGIWRRLVAALARNDEAESRRCTDLLSRVNRLWLHTDRTLALAALSVRQLLQFGVLAEWGRRSDRDDAAVTAWLDGRLVDVLRATSPLQIFEALHALDGAIRAAGSAPEIQARAFWNCPAWGRLIPYVLELAGGSVSANPRADTPGVRVQAQVVALRYLHAAVRENRSALRPFEDAWKALRDAADLQGQLRARLEARVALDGPQPGTEAVLAVMRNLPGGPLPGRILTCAVPVLADGSEMFEKVRAALETQRYTDGLPLLHAIREQIRVHDQDTMNATRDEYEGEESAFDRHDFYPDADRGHEHILAVVSRLSAGGGYFNAVGHAAYMQLKHRLRLVKAKSHVDWHKLAEAGNVWRLLESAIAVFNLNSFRTPAADDKTRRAILAAASCLMSLCPYVEADVEQQRPPSILMLCSWDTRPRLIALGPRGKDRYLSGRGVSCADDKAMHGTYFKALASIRKSKVYDAARDALARHVDPKTADEAYRRAIERFESFERGSAREQ